MPIQQSFFFALVCACVCVCVCGYFFLPSAMDVFDKYYRTTAEVHVHVHVYLPTMEDGPCF